jgi:hypothetical protein
MPAAHARAIGVEFTQQVHRGKHHEVERKVEAAALTGGLELQTTIAGHQPATRRRPLPADSISSIAVVGAVRFASKATQASCSASRTRRARASATAASRVAFSPCDRRFAATRESTAPASAAHSMSRA